MQIQINTDANIHGTEHLAEHVKALVSGPLDRFSQHVTRLEVHLGDEHAGKAGAPDKRCMLEARLEGHPPTAVTHHAATLDKAVHGAAEKLERTLDGLVERLHARR